MSLKNFDIIQRNLMNRIINASSCNIKLVVRKLMPYFVVEIVIDLLTF